MSLEKKIGGVMAGPTSGTDPQPLAESQEEPELQAESQDTEAEKRLARLYEQYGATWDGPNDPNDPYNWPEWRKIVIGTIFSIGQLVTLMSASIIAAALGNISRDLGIDASTTQITLSIYFLGLAFGPFFVAALGEMNGRKTTWVASNIWFLAATGASAGIILTGPVMADMYHAKDRGKSLAIASFLPYLGPALGPIIGGVVVELIHWPWLFWIVSIFDAIITILGALVIKESYTPVLLRRKKVAQSGQAATPALSLTQCAYWHDFLTRLAVYLQRPIRLLIRRPIIQVISLIYALNFGIYTLLLSTFATLWIDRYGQSPLIGSLHYIAFSIGFVISAQVGSRLMDVIYKRLRDRPKNKGVGRPEFRAPYMVPGAVFVLAGLFWYGWSAEYRITWVMVDIGAVLFTLGSTILSQALLAYTLDIFGELGASAGAAARLLSNILGFVFPIFAPQLYDRLGYGWGNSLLAFIFMVLGLPVPFFLWIWGEKLRALGKKHHEDD